MRSQVITLIVVLIIPGVALTEDITPGSSASSRLHLIKPRNPKGLRDLFKYNGESMCFVSAHRGGAQRGFPENCIATFENTLEHTFAIMEIDPRYSRDGAIIVHHDATLDRTTTGEGRVADFTLSDLKTLRLKDAEGAVTGFRIPTLDEVLQWARGKTILVLDQKDVPVEARVRKIEQHNAEAYAMLIVYSFEDAGKCYELNKDIMMEVMISNRERFHAFNETGIPWSNIIAFVGHTPPKDKELLRMIHAKGTCCMVGTSRNLDREFVAAGSSSIAAIEQHYRTLLQQGVDVIETDLPRKVGKVVFRDSSIPPSKSKFFQVPHQEETALLGNLLAIQRFARMDKISVLHSRGGAFEQTDDFACCRLDLFRF